MEADGVRVATYRRISIESGAENGSNVSLDVQRERLRALAAAHGWEVVADFCDDGYSGKSLDRPGMQKLLEALRQKPRPFDAVLIYSLSRATRRVADLGHLLEEFDRAGVGLVSLTEGVDSNTGAGRLVLNILGSVAEWERQEIASRTKAALQHKRANLEVYNGETVYGFARRGKKLEPVPAELAAVRRMLTLRRQGFSLRQISQTLADEGIRTKHGRKRFTAQTVSDILNRESFYAPHLERPW